MRVQISGKVVEVERRSFTAQDGTPTQAFDAFLASDNPRYGAERISGPADLTPEVGEVASFTALVTARTGKRGPWLSVWCVERTDAA